MIENRRLYSLGKALSNTATNMMLLAGNERVGVAIQKQWIKDLRSIAYDMEREMKHGEASKAD